MREKAGWELASDAKALLESRLSRYKGGAKDLFSGKGHLLLDALTVQETYFFREEPAIRGFLAVAGEFPAWRPLRVWCAACATGQEPYSLAITALEHRVPVDIYASDISPSALEKARQGFYHPLEVGRGMGQDRLKRFFDPVGQGFVVKEEVKRLVRFFPHNLLNPLTATTGSFDLLFCRNVLYYFSQDKKERAVKHLLREIVPGGYLVLSSTENLWGMAPWVQTRDVGGVTFYRRSETPAPV